MGHKLICPLFGVSLVRDPVWIVFGVPCRFLTGYSTGQDHSNLTAFLVRRLFIPPTFHPFSRPEDSDFGQQCCYGGDGELVRGSSSGGSSDSMSQKRDYDRHVSDDLLPYVLCCRSGTVNCGAYYEGRPSGSEEGYSLPIPGSLNDDYSVM